MTEISSGDPIKVLRMIHTIHAITDINTIRMQYQNVFNGIVFSEGYFPPEDRDHALLYAADHMVEPMAPRNPDKTEFAFVRYIKKFGEGWHSISVKVEDAKAAAARLEAAGCKLVSNYGLFFYVRAASTGGILIELTELNMPNDPYDLPNWNPSWADGTPIGLKGLDHIACVVPEIDTPLRFFTQLLEGHILSDEKVTAPQTARRVMIRLGDLNMALVCPEDSGSGPLGAFLGKPNSSIYALVWRVEDEARARDFLTSDRLEVFNGRKLRLEEENCIGGSFAIDPRDFARARHEFKGD